jgi:hypothetical protein
MTEQRYFFRGSALGEQVALKRWDGGWTRLGPGLSNSEFEAVLKERLD